MKQYPALVQAAEAIAKKQKAQGCILLTDHGGDDIRVAMVGLSEHRVRDLLGIAIANSYSDETEPDFATDLEMLFEIVDRLRRAKFMDLGKDAELGIACRSSTRLRGR
jgi:hypothetical protein